MARILIIDDDDLLRQVLAQTLTMSGHTVVQADNGHAGLDQFRAAPADLVITDIIMPVQEGVETILQLRREQPKLPIIAMSGGVANSKLYLNIAGRIGADYVLSKPFSPQELIDAVNRVLGRSQMPPGPAPQR